MKKITPHLWFDKHAKDAAQFYTSLFSNSKVESISTITNTPSGDCDIVSFSLEGEPFMAISAGPNFKINPSISFFVSFSEEEEISKVYTALSNEGTSLMPYDTYPWAEKYAWLQDKYGVSWQLSLSTTHSYAQKITPFLMFTGPVAGKAKEAIDFYTNIFPNSKTNTVVNYQEGDGDKVGFIKHSQFTLNNQLFMAIDSSLDHKFIFNEAISLIINCDTQEEIDYYWEKLSAVPEAEQCGWLKDKYGVSWQITPTVMDEMMTKGNSKQREAVTNAFLKMKKFDIKTLEKAYNS